MRAVGHEDTAAEVKLRKALWRAGFRYRKHKKVEGIRPDLCLVVDRVAVFVDGCFWHGCPSHYTAPIQNAEFWNAKLERNRMRDARVTLRLAEAGWKVLRFWECEVNRQIEDVVERIAGEVSRQRKS